MLGHCTHFIEVVLNNSEKNTGTGTRHFVSNDLDTGDEIRCVGTDRVDNVAADRIQGILLALDYLHSFLVIIGNPI
jgi:hypothetical protein